MMKNHLAPILAILMAVLVAIPAVAAGPFPDVSPTHWAYESVNRLAEAGLVEGFPNGRFQGGQPITRYEMAMVIARLLTRLDKQVREQEAKLEPVQPAQEEKPVEKVIERVVEKVIVEKPIIEKIVEREIVEKTGSVDKATLEAKVRETITIIEALKVEFADELASLGVKVSALEQQLAAANAGMKDLGTRMTRVEKVIEDMEKVRISGSSQVTLDSVNLAGSGTPWRDPFNKNNNNDPGNATNPAYVYQRTSRFDHELKLMFTANVAEGVVANAGLSAINNILGGGWSNEFFKVQDLYLDVVTPGMLRHLRVGPVANPAGSFTDFTMWSNYARVRDGSGNPVNEGVLAELAWNNLNTAGILWRLAPVNDDPGTPSNEARFGKNVVAADGKMPLSPNLRVGATYVRVADDTRVVPGLGTPAADPNNTVGGVSAEFTLAPGWKVSGEVAQYLEGGSAAAKIGATGKIGTLEFKGQHTRIAPGFAPYFVQPYSAKGLKTDVNTYSIEGVLPIRNLKLSAGYDISGDYDWTDSLVATKKGGAEYSLKLAGIGLTGVLNVSMAHNFVGAPVDTLTTLKEIKAAYAPVSVDYAITDVTRDGTWTSNKRVLDIALSHPLTSNVSVMGGYKSYAFDDLAGGSDEIYNTKKAGVQVSMNLTTTTKLAAAYNYENTEYVTPWYEGASSIAGVKYTVSGEAETKISPKATLVGKLALTSGVLADPGVDGQATSGEVGFKYNIAKNADLDLGYKAARFDAPGTSDDYTMNAANATLKVKF